MSRQPLKLKTICFQWALGFYLHNANSHILFCSIFAVPLTLHSVCDMGVWLQVRATSARWRWTTRTAKSLFTTTGNRWVSDWASSHCLRLAGVLLLWWPPSLHTAYKLLLVSFFQFWRSLPAVSQKKGKIHLFDFRIRRLICVLSSVKKERVRTFDLTRTLCVPYAVQGILQEQLCLLCLSSLKFSHSEKWKSHPC